MQKLYVIDYDDIHGIPYDSVLNYFTIRYRSVLYKMDIREITMFLDDIISTHLKMIQNANIYTVVWLIQKQNSIPLKKLKILIFFLEFKTRTQ